MKILILGAGFGGLELATRLSEELGDEIEVDLIDKASGFVFGFSKLDVMFGKATADSVFHPYDAIAKPGLRFTQTTVRSIDPEQKSVVTDAGRFEADIMVVALGADLEPSATPGLLECGNEFYTVPGAFALRDVLDSFGGGNVIVGVTSTPFKCPPAPSETVLLMHEFLTTKGLRRDSSISLVMPLGVPIPPSPGPPRHCSPPLPNGGSTGIRRSWSPASMRSGTSHSSATAMRCRSICFWVSRCTRPRRS